jgi:hypothetical protein
LFLNQSILNQKKLAVISLNLTILYSLCFMLYKVTLAVQDNQVCKLGSCSLVCVVLFVFIPNALIKWSDLLFNIILTVLWA